MLRDLFHTKTQANILPVMLFADETSGRQFVCKLYVVKKLKAVAKLAQNG